MTNISLIYPPFHNSIRTTLPDFIDKSEGVFPPLGIMYISSYLKKHNPGVNVQLIDSVLSGYDYARIADEVVRHGADIAGITCWTFSLLDALNTAREIKKRKSSVKIVFGGPHVNIYPLETMKNGFIDYVIVNDGEKAFDALVKALEGGSGLPGVPNLYYRENGEIKKSAVECEETDLDSLPFPDRASTAYADYSSILDDVSPITTLITSRGCPFRCSFCMKDGTGWRARKVESIIAEIRECIGLGIRNFTIFDETFTANKKRTLDFCRAVIDGKLDIVWNCRSRVDTVDEEALDRLKEAGCRRVSLGVESADETVLKRLNKNISLAQVSRVFKKARAIGMATLADFMIACPGETPESTKKTIDFARALNPDYVQFSLFTLLPETKLYEEALKQGVVSRDVWAEYATAPDKDFKPPLWNIYSEEDSLKLLPYAYKRFYFRLPYILGVFKRMRSFKQFALYLKAGMGLISGLWKGK